MDDDPDPDQTLWGLYSVLQIPSIQSLKLDLYYLGLDRDEAEFDQGIADETRHTVGTRIWGQAFGWDYNFELVYQFGTFGAGNIHAWTVASDSGYTITWGSGQKLRFGLRADITSGDKDPNDPDLQTFNPLLPKGAYFGLISSAGPSNHRDLHLSIRFWPTQKVSIEFDWLFYWRHSLDDGLYAVPVSILRTGQNSRARFVGHQPGLEIVWQIDRHVSITGNYAYFFAGPFLKETPPGEDIRYLAAWVTYKF